MARSWIVGVVVAVLATASGCGERGSEEGSGGGLPWRGGPVEEVGEALAWVPALPGGEATVFDLPVLRERRKGMPPQREHDAADWRRFLVGELGLPDDALGLGVVVYWKEGGMGTSWPHLHAARVPLDVVRASAARLGLAEATDAGATVWRHEGGEEIARWSNGWVRSKPRARGGLGEEFVEAPAQARPVLDAHPWLAEALGAVPADALSKGPVEVHWGRGVSLDAGPAVRPVATAEWRETSPPGAGVVLAFATDGERAASRKEMDRLFEEAKRRGLKDVSLRIEERGRFARMLSSSATPPPDEVVRKVAVELRTLANALDAYRGETGSYPGAEEGLAALAKHSRFLDDFLGVVPVDPWDRPYHYRPPPPGGAEPDLRSRGPDGEIDTEDDVFPGE
jgi:hypothetical protein